MQEGRSKGMASNVGGECGEWREVISIHTDIVQLPLLVGQNYEICVCISSRKNGVFDQLVGKTNFMMYV